MPTNTNLGTVVAETTMRLAVEILHQQGVTVGDDKMDDFVQALRREAKAAINRLLEQGKDLLDGGMGGWLNALLATECAEAARNAVAEVA